MQANKKDTGGWWSATILIAGLCGIAITLSLGQKFRPTPKSALKTDRAVPQVAAKSIAAGLKTGTAGVRQAAKVANSPAGTPAVTKGKSAAKPSAGLRMPQVATNSTASLSRTGGSSLKIQASQVPDDRSTTSSILQPLPAGEKNVASAPPSAPKAEVIPWLPGKQAPVDDAPGRSRVSDLGSVAVIPASNVDSAPRSAVVAAGNSGEPGADLPGQVRITDLTNSRSGGTRNGQSLAQHEELPPAIPAELISQPAGRVRISDLASPAPAEASTELAMNQAEDESAKAAEPVQGGEESKAAEEPMGEASVAVPPLSDDGVEDQFKPLIDFRTKIRAGGDNLPVPPDAAAKVFGSKDKKFDYSGVLDGTWDAPGSLAPTYPFYFRPLRFEDPNLERCGYSYGLFMQPLASGVHFYTSCALLPFKMLLLSGDTCVEPKPDCGPCTKYDFIDNTLGEEFYWLHGD